MGRKAGQQNKNIVEVASDEQATRVEQTFEELVSSDGCIDANYHARLLDFLAKSDLTVNEAQFHLYKYENYMSGEAKAWVAKYVESEPPDEAEVARAFGSGRYLLIMTVPGKSIVRSYRFRISALCDGARPEVSPHPIVYDNRKNNDGMKDAVLLFQQVVATLIPLLRPPESANYSKMMDSNYSMVADVMRKSMMSNVELMEEYQRKVSMLKSKNDHRVIDMQQEEDSSNENNFATIIAQIAPLLEAYLPKILGGGAQGKVVSGMVRDSAMFHEIKRNRSMVNALIAYLDQEKGADETDKILSALSLKRVVQKKVVAK